MWIPSHVGRENVERLQLAAGIGESPVSPHSKGQAVAPDQP